MAASPTRRPVNEPGPETTAKPSMACLLKPWRFSASAICGTSCAEKVPPSSATISSVRAFPSSNSTRAMLPPFPDVSTPRISIGSRLTACLDEFNQHARSAGGMEKNVAMPTGAGFNFVRNQAGAFSLQSLHRSLQIRDANGNVMQAFATLGNEFGDDRIL